MPNTFFGLSIATSGLFAANTALNVTGHNISNERTEGYCKQSASQSAGDAIRIYQEYGTIGSGVVVNEITQSRDEYYDVKYWNNNNKLGEQSTKAYYELQVEDYFNEMDIDGFTTEYQNLFNSLESLKGTPADNTYRNATINYAQSLIDYFKEIKNNLTNTQVDVNQEVSNKVDEINTIAASLTTLNRQINTIEMNGTNANDLRDRRALLLDQLSAIVPISVNEVTYDNGKTDFTVKIGGKTLVNSYDYYTLEVKSRKDLNTSTDAAGLYDIKWSYGDTFDPVAEGYSGELASLMQIRDGNNGTVETGNDNSVSVNCKGVPYYIGKINAFLDEFTSEFNEVQQSGQDLSGNSTADVPFFLKSENGTYQVNPDIVKNPSLMATSTSVVDGEGGADLVEKLIALKDAKNYQGGSATEYLQSIVSEISIDCKKAQTLESNYKNLKSTITNQRLSISGVDGDEEAMNLVKFQESYNLSAKMISVMNEIYDKLINGTGV